MQLVYLTWELGGGFGHLANLYPLVQGLHERGHRISLALKDLSRAGKAFSSLNVSFLQAPHKTRKPDFPIEPPRTFAHILHNSGFGDPDELRVLVAAWRNLYDFVRPNLIVFDHSPTALLASRGLPVNRTAGVWIRVAFRSDHQAAMSPSPPSWPISSSTRALTLRGKSLPVPLLARAST